MELGRSVEQASRPKKIRETDLVPKRIRPVVQAPEEGQAPAERVVPFDPPKPAPRVARSTGSAVPAANLATEEAPISSVDREKLELALSKLSKLRERWEEFR